MNDVERANPFEESVLSAIGGKLAATWTALPGIIESFDPVRGATVQPSIQAEVTAQDGSISLATLPLLLDCPVQFPEGGDCVLTFPVKPGDECLVVFASRCIDAWWQSGGVQPQAELRMHDLSDGFVLLGFRSQPNITTGISTTAVELRSKDGATSISLDPAAQTMAFKAPGGFSFEGPITADSTITADGDVVGAGVSLETHVHSGVTSGGSNTGAPT